MKRTKISYEVVRIPRSEIEALILKHYDLPRGRITWPSTTSLYWGDPQVTVTIDATS